MAKMTISGSMLGIRVNSAIAEIYGNEWVANDVSLSAGENTIEVMATAEGFDDAVTKSISVTATGTPKPISLVTSARSGVAPLEAYFFVASDLANPIAEYRIDFEGDGIIDYIGASFDNISHTYASEGIYYPSLTVTDGVGNVYSDTLVVAVLPLADMDEHLKGIWDEMKGALAEGDIEGALIFFTEDSKEKYRKAFTLLQDDVSDLSIDMQDVELIYLKGEIAKYRIRREQLFNGQLLTITYYIYLTKNNAGIWQIEQF